MALLNIKRNYIKMYKDGGYEVYPTLEDREKIKYSTDKDTIIAKYKNLYENSYNDLIAYMQKNNIIESDFKDEQKWNYLLDKDKKLKDLFIITGKIEEEYSNYLYALNCNNGDFCDFPIIKEYFPDIKNSIPKIIEKGKIDLKGEVLKEVYDKAKIKRRFGEVMDI